ncbi:peptidase complex beta subunit Qcr1 [Schizosaccharomyces japonicus yFS275]|uniref:mitochondrial processing peptidase n=1 Tax=Schizosaccharomyces japonicus (strain yFS275 / FY16936) TaxID=402676 RepID=B6K2C9_SCHJY|nr:peptidase complex beta subunit Qcr1 [Schizosaccharomyces japonicus yFS275]EEB07310.1 peptidase complex beta subunit Qcr1 [Schizosaccharomyces japonicus yFS275]
MFRLRSFPKLTRRFASLSLPKTQSTTLRNGLTVATEYHPFAQTATVLVGVDAGSRAENEKNNGAAHFLEHLAFKGTKSRSQQDLELEFENAGAHLNAYTSREQTVYYAHSFKDEVPKTVSVLADILQNSTISKDAVERERQVILREQEEVDKVTDEVVFDHLHATAFQGQSLGRTILGPRENIESLRREDLLKYIADNYRSDRIIIAGAGAIPHEQLVELAEKHFSGLKPSDHPVSIGSPRSPKPRFVGSEVRVRDDEMSTANIAIAVEGVSWKDPDYFTALVMQAIVGNWDRAMAAGPHMSSRLGAVVQKEKLANSFMSFSTSYSDTGLWGIYLVSENLLRLDDLVYFALQEWTKLCNPLSAEVERAKAQLKASLLLSLDSTTAIAEDIGRQLLTTGRRMTPEEISKNIDSITEKDVSRVAQNMIWDKDIAVSAVGAVEGLLDYNRVRSAISANRY